MKFYDAIDEYLRDMQAAGRINSPATVRLYRDTLLVHADDVSNRSPHTTGRDDVKRTLARWKNPNSQRTRRSVLVSFYRWTVEEGIRPSNPAEQTRRPRKRPTKVYRLTRDETARMLAAPGTVVEQRVIALGICAGLRNAELRGLQGRHFRRPGFIWVSADIAKGKRERWLPVITDLQAIVADIVATVGDDEYVLPAQRWRDPGTNQHRTSLTKRPMSQQALYQLVRRVGVRAGIAADIHPHLLRHAYGDHVAKHAGLLVAQALLGHASVETTRETYVGHVSLDDLAEAVGAFTLAYPSARPPKTPVEAPTRIELVASPSREFIALLAFLRDEFTPLARSLT